MPLWDFDVQKASDVQRTLKITVIAELFIVMTITGHSALLYRWRSIREKFTQKYHFREKANPKISNPKSRNTVEKQ